MNGPVSNYYPKLQVAVPFTPATGRRLLVAPGGGDAAQATLILGLRKWREQVASLLDPHHLPDKGGMGGTRPSGLSAADRASNSISSTRAMRSFEAFLADLASRKRKMIRRERKELSGGWHRDRNY